MSASPTAGVAGSPVLVVQLRLHVAGRGAITVRARTSVHWSQDQEGPEAHVRSAEVRWRRGVRLRSECAQEVQQRATVAVWE